MSKAILIDPVKKRVDEIDIDLNSLEAIYEVMECRQIEAHTLPKSRNIILLDEEALLKQNQPATFYLKDATPLLGKALIVSSNSKGDFISPRSSLLDIADIVEFPR
jgi:hypothetical protein